MTPEQIRKLLIDTMDATFMTKGFKPERHADAVLEVLKKHNLHITEKPNHDYEYA